MPKDTIALPKRYWKNWVTNSILLGEYHFRQRSKPLGYRDVFHLQSGSSHLHYLGFGADCVVNLQEMAEVLNIQRLRAGPFSRCP